MSIICIRSCCRGHGGFMHELNNSLEDDIVGLIMIAAGCLWFIFGVVVGYMVTLCTY